MSIRFRRMMLAVVLALVSGGLAVPLVADGPPTWNVRDIFVSLQSGGYMVLDGSSPTTVKQIIDTPVEEGQPDGPTAGCAFDSSFNLLGVYSDAAEIVKFNVDGSHDASVFASPGSDLDSDGHSQSIVFAANGDVYVSNPDDGLILRYSSSGELLQRYSVTGLDEGESPTWLDLATDQKTMYFTTGRRRVSTFNVVPQVTSGDAETTRSQPIVATFTLTGLGTAGALRLLPPFDGTGGLLVADGVNIKRLNASGTQVKTYDATTANDAEGFQALALDPDGLSFWAADHTTIEELTTNKLFRFAIGAPSGSGVPLAGYPIDLGVGNEPTGLCVMGQAQLQIQPLNLVNNPGAAIKSFDLTAKFGDPVSFGNPNALNGFSTWSMRVQILANSGGIGAVSFTPQVSSGRCDGHTDTETYDCSDFDSRFTTLANAGAFFVPTQCVPFFKDPSIVAGGGTYATTGAYKCGQYRTKDLPESAYVPNTIFVILDLTNPPWPSPAILNRSLYGNGPKGVGNPRTIKDPRRCDVFPAARQIVCASDDFFIDSTVAIIDYPAISRSQPTSVADYSPTQRLAGNGANGPNSANACGNIIKPPDGSKQNSGSTIKLTLEASTSCSNGLVPHNAAGNVINPITNAATAPNRISLAIAGTGTNHLLIIYCNTPGNSLGCFTPVPSQPGRYASTVQLDPKVIPADNAITNPYVFAVTSIQDVSTDPAQQGSGLFTPVSAKYSICSTGSCK